MDILGHDFRTRFCIQPLAWFNSGYSSCLNVTVTLQCLSSSTVRVKHSCHAELLGFRQSGARCPPPRGEEYENNGFLQTTTTIGSVADTVHESVLSHKLPHRILVTVDAKRFRCAEILSRPSVFGRTDGNVIGVDAKRSHCAELVSGPSAYDRQDRNINTVGDRRFRSAEHLFGTRREHPLFAANASISGMQQLRLTASVRRTRAVLP